MGLECTNCTAGFFAPFVGSSVCTACEYPLVALEFGTIFCTVCDYDSGLFAASFSECISCDPGYELRPFELLLQGDECAPCQVGEYRNADSDTCQPCPPQTFTAQPEANTFCDACPVNSIGLDGTACNRCPDDQVAYRDACTECQFGSINTEIGVCQCPTGTYSSTLEGVFTPPGCVDCPRGAECEVPGLVADEVNPLPGWWRESNNKTNDGTIKMYECNRVAHCQGDAFDSCAPNREGPLCALCIDGYFEAQNGVCRVCPESGSAWGLSIVFILILVAVFVVLLYFMFKTTDRADAAKMVKKFLPKKRIVQLKWEVPGETFSVDGSVKRPGRKGTVEQIYIMDDQFADTTDQLDQYVHPENIEPEKEEGEVNIVEMDLAYVLNTAAWRVEQELLVASMEIDQEEEEEADKELDFHNLATETVLTIENRRLPISTFKYKVVVSFLQISFAVQSAVRVTWPTAYASFIRTFDFVNLDIIPWNTIGCALSLDFYAQYRLTILVSIGTVLFFCLMALLVMFWDRSRGREFEIRAFWIKLFLYSMFLLYPTLCRTVMEYVTCDYVVDTWYLRSDYEVECFDEAWTNSLIWFILGAILFPIAIPFILFILLWKNHKRMDFPNTIYVYGFLYGAYHPSQWWMETYDMLNKFMLTGVMGLFPFAVQSTVGMMSIYVYLALILLISPIIRRQDDMLQVYSLNIILLTFILSKTLETETMTQGMDIFLGIIMIAVTLAVFFLFAYYAFKTLQSKIFRRDKDVMQVENLNIEEDLALLKTRPGLVTYLQEPQKHHSFLSFLTSEYCEENLEYYDDYVQVQEENEELFKSLRKVNDMKKNKAAEAGGGVEVKEALPMAEMVNEADSAALMIGISSLYCDYIANDAEKLINISGSMRKKIVKMLSSLGYEKSRMQQLKTIIPTAGVVPALRTEQAADLLYLMDQTRDEIVRLLHGGVNGFLESSYFLDLYDDTKKSESLPGSQTFVIERKVLNSRFLGSLWEKVSSSAEQKLISKKGNLKRSSSKIFRTKSHDPDLIIDDEDGDNGVEMSSFNGSKSKNTSSLASPSKSSIRGGKLRSYGGAGGGRKKGFLEQQPQMMRPDIIAKSRIPEEDDDDDEEEEKQHQDDNSGGGTEEEAAQESWKARKTGAGRGGKGGGYGLKDAHASLW